MPHILYVFVNRFIGNITLSLLYVRLGIPAQVEMKAFANHLLASAFAIPHKQYLKLSTSRPTLSKSKDAD